MYKISNGLSPILIRELFMASNEQNYCLRHLHQFKTTSVNTVYHGKESVSFLGPKIWEILLNDFKKIDNRDAFKKVIKT